MGYVVGAADKKHKAKLQKIVDALELNSIVFEDHDNHEVYILEPKRGKKIRLEARGNQIDGGYLITDFE